MTPADRITPPADEVTHRLRELQTRPGWRFDAYQAIPEAVLRRAPELRVLSYRESQLGLDATRYAWLRNHFDKRDVSIADIGGNIGGFALSLAADIGATAILYEPIKEYCEICRLLAEISGLESINIVSQGIGLDDIPKIPAVDLVIHLNVLHHAGSVFDNDAFTAHGGWLPYARAYLEALGDRARYLFFQTGNISSGDQHFPGEETLPLLHDLLNHSGWVVQKVGVIEDFTTLQYVTYEPEALNAAPSVTCWRNPDSGLVDYKVGGTVVASLPKGTAQRPLWFARNLRS